MVERCTVGKKRETKRERERVRQRGERERERACVQGFVVSVWGCVLRVGVCVCAECLRVCMYVLECVCHTVANSLRRSIDQFRAWVDSCAAC